MDAPKKGKLTLALLGLSPKGKGGSEPEEETDSEPSESESSDELPMGLQEAVREFLDAAKEDDSEAAASALHRALQCCDLC